MITKDSYQIIFPTTEVLRKGLRQLAFKHENLQVVISESQYNTLREKGFMRANEFDEIWKNLQKETNIEFKPQNFSNLSLEKELEERLEEVANQKIRWINRDVNSGIAMQGNISMIRNQEWSIKNDISTIRILASRLKVPPLFLISSADKDFYAVTDLPYIEIKEFKKSSQPLKRLRKEIRWAEFLGKFIVSNIIFYLITFTLLLSFSISYIKGEDLSNWKYLVDKLLNLPSWGLVIFFAFFGFYFYWWRSLSRFTYGIAEILVGLILVVFNIPKDNQRSEIIYWLPIIAAIYVIVRGFDNIGNSVKNNDKLKYRWSQIFGKDF